MASLTRVYLITGCSSGFGSSLAQYLLEKGQIVIATARNQSTVAHFQEKYPDTALSLSLDITNQDSVNKAIQSALNKFQKVDVLVNNAGNAIYGLVEFTSESEIRAQMETNFFGTVRITQAILPIMRKQNSGHIIQFSSVSGQNGSQCLPFYCASKFALEGFSESLSREVIGFNVRVTIIEPGAFKTDMMNKSFVHIENKIVPEPYKTQVEKINQRMDFIRDHAPGDPMKAAAIIHQLVESNNPPLRLPLGGDAFQTITSHVEQQLLELKKWERVSKSTNLDNAI
ncbi:SDR family oxidoreductase [Brasilonema sp. CT11]|nr:SDR family oxidoreductase [Brasilonema sp. CT11]